MAVADRTIDAVIISLYLIATIGVSFYRGRKNRDADDYFFAHRSLPGWALTISMITSSVSSISFFALPAAAFAKDFRNFTPRLILPIVGAIAALYIVPIFRKINVHSTFEYLEQRYNVIIRIYASSAYLILQLFRLGTILYLLSIPLSIIFNKNVPLVIAVIAAIVGTYTIRGGLRAVVWMNTIQSFVIFSGCVLCFIYVLRDIPGGIKEVIDIGLTNHKFGLGTFAFSLSERSFWLMIIFGIINYGTEHTGNQVVIQRYLAAQNLRQAQHATFISSCTMLPVWLILFFLGSCLFAHYQIYPDQQIATMPADKILSHFILTTIPVGIAGVIIAACIAAALTSLDSAMNAVSSVILYDVTKRFFVKNNDPERDLKLSRYLSALTLLLAVIFAVIINLTPKECIVDLGYILSSLIGGSLFSIYIIALFTKNIDGRSLIGALSVSILVNIYLALNTINLIPASIKLHLHPNAAMIIVNATLLISAVIITLARRKILPRKTADFGRNTRQ